MPPREVDSAANRLVLRWHRVKGGWRCVLGIHRWRGHHDLGDNINVQPISGYRKPHGARDFRVCSWCGAHAVAFRIGDDRMRSFVWGRTDD